MNKSGLIIESRIVHELQSGSYEDLLARMDRAVFESNLFGEGAILFSTHPDKIVVLNESGIFFSASYKEDDKILFSNVKKMDVSVISEGDITSHGIDKFYESKSLRDNLRALVGMELDESRAERTAERVRRLFSGGSLWRNYVKESREKIGAYSWDASFGPLKLDVKEEFAEICSGKVSEENLEDFREDVLGKLSILESMISNQYVSARDAFNDYLKVTHKRDLGADEVLSRFESFATDYLDHIRDLSSFVSEAVRESEEGCVLCAAMIHDEFAKRFREIELGGRFVRKVSSEFSK